MGVVYSRRNRWMLAKGSAAGLAVLVLQLAPGPVTARASGAPDVAVADSSWSRPQRVGAQAVDLSLTLGGRLATTLVWKQGGWYHDGPLVLRRREVAGAWLPRRQLGEGFTPAGVASNRHGIIVAAWFQRHQGRERLVVTRLGDEGRRQRVVVVDRKVSPRRVGAPQVAVGSGGAVVVWWDEVIEEADCGDYAATFLVYGTGDGTWDPPHEVGDRSCVSGHAAAAVGDRGNVNVAYSTASGLRFTRRVVGRGWTVARPLTARPGRSGPVLMRTGRGGTLVVAWQRRDEKGFEARRRLGGRWGPVLSWADGTRAAGGASAAMDRRGNTALSWVDEEGAIRGRWWPRVAGAGASRVVVGPSGTPDDGPGRLQMAAGAAGHVVVAYSSEISGSGLHVVRARRNGPWQRQPSLLMAKGLGDYEVGVEPSGAVHLAWIADEYAPHPGIWHSRLSTGRGSR